MLETGHFQQLRPLISDLAADNFAVHVFTHQLFAADVARMGATFVDLFSPHPLEAADSESTPFPCRYVSFAAANAEDVVEEVRRLAPILILYETFAVIGRLAAIVLRIPFVNVSAGHAVDPARFLRLLGDDPRVAVSENCHRASEMLRTRYGLSDASPFCYFTGLSPYLNICSEPPEFLTAEERSVFEPVAFYGCLWSAPEAAESSLGEARYLDASSRSLRIYACLGTTVGRYYAGAALRVLESLAECMERLPAAQAVISLGGVSLGDKAGDLLARPRVKVVEYADQWRALAEADLFLTHNGINSTHEAIALRVPMLSYPFFWDQPGLAERCRQFGIAVPLSEMPRGPVAAERILALVAEVAKNREAFDARLAQVAAWERDVIARRSAVLRRIEALA
jgi:UDP:flavonoid glycosyltransferase YjiC (YdhE family)